MIVEMKKLTLLLYHREKEQFLETLREQGVVHVEENPEAGSDALRDLQERIRTAERVRQALSRRSASKKLSLEQAADVDAETVVERYGELEAEIEKRENQLQVQRKNIGILEPWGDFDPRNIELLRERGIRTRFLVMPAKRAASLADVAIPFEVIARTTGSVFFVVFERDEKADIEAEEVSLPDISLGAARRRREELESKKRDAEKRLDEMTRYQGVLDAFLAEQHSGRAMEAARLSMEAQVEGRVLSFTGWVPDAKVGSLQAFLDRFPAWYRIENAGPEDNAPVQLVNGKGVNLFEPIVNIYSLPDYFELDPTPFIAPFFAFFFGLCLADVGYGLLLGLVSAIGLMKGPAKLRRFMALGLVLSAFTIVGGIFLNSFFGAAIFVDPGTPGGFISQGRAGALLAPVETDAGTYFPAMPFAVYIGVLQILVGITLKGVNRARNNGFAWAIQPISHVMMVVGLTAYLASIDFMDLRKFEFGRLALGDIVGGVPQVAVFSLIFGGLALHMLFNNPNKGLPTRMGLGLWELYQFASGFMSDGLSYLRLFALGLAGGLLGAAFNQIAFMFITAKDGTVNYASVGIIGTIFVLLVGHTLNFILAALGAFVHPLRLTFVEFYNNLQFKGGGKPYRPLSKGIQA